MTEKKRASKTYTLTPRECEFVGAYDGSINGTARRIGMDRRNAHEMAKRPRVKAALDKKMDAFALESGKRLGEKIDIGPVEIINRLAKIGRLEEFDRDGNRANLNAISSALKTLADVFGLRSKVDASTVFAGWTPEERIRYSDTRDIPARFRGTTSPNS